MREGAAGIQLFPFGVKFKGGLEFESAIRCCGPPNMDELTACCDTEIETMIQRHFW